MFSAQPFDHKRHHWCIMRMNLQPLTQGAPQENPVLTVERM
jgi:hypothetical protein